MQRTDYNVSETVLIHLSYTVINNNKIILQSKVPHPRMSILSYAHMTLILTKWPWYSTLT